VSASTLVTSGTRQRSKLGFASSLFPASPAPAPSAPNETAQKPPEITARFRSRPARPTPRPRSTAPGVPGNHRLVRRIQICRRTNFASAARLQASATTAGDKPIIAAIAPTPRNRILHVRPAPTHELNGIRKLQRACGHQAADTLRDCAGHEIRPSAPSPPARDTPQRSKSKCRLRVRRQLEIFFSALKAYPRNREAQSSIGFVKNGLRCGYFLRQLFAHTGYCEACPGNTNATLPIVNPFLAPSRNNRGGRQLLFDFLVHRGSRRARVRRRPARADGVSTRGVERRARSRNEKIEQELSAAAVIA